MVFSRIKNKSLFVTEFKAVVIVFLLNKPPNFPKPLSSTATYLLQCFGLKHLPKCLMLSLKDLYSLF